MEKLEANMILEILGRPKEHIFQSLNELIDRLSKEKGVVIKERKIHDPVDVKDAKDIFTTFAEIHIEFDSFLTYYAVLFAYMPSNIEIISPERTVLKNDELNLIGNRLIQRLHDYDSIVKKTLMDRDNLALLLKQFAPHLFDKNVPIKVQDEIEKAKKKNSRVKKKSKRS